MTDVTFGRHWILFLFVVFGTIGRVLFVNARHDLQWRFQIFKYCKIANYAVISIKNFIDHNGNWIYTPIQCHIKARALRAAAQGPRLKSCHQTNLSCNIVNIKHKLMLTYWRENIKSSLTIIKNYPRAPECLKAALHTPAQQIQWNAFSYMTLNQNSCNNVELQAAKCVITF